MSISAVLSIVGWIGLACLIVVVYLVVIEMLQDAVGWMVDRIKEDR